MSRTRISLVRSTSSELETPIDQLDEIQPFEIALMVRSGVADELLRDPGGRPGLVDEDQALAANVDSRCDRRIDDGIHPLQPPVLQSPPNRPPEARELPEPPEAARLQRAHTELHDARAPQSSVRMTG
jgi:hypothetical protein